MKGISTSRYFISLASVAILAGGGVYIWQQAEQQSAATVVEETQTEESGIAKIEQLFEQIKGNYYQEVDEDALIEGALQGMTDALDDPYTTYLSESAADELDQSLSGSFEGIGATLSLVDEYPEIAQAPIKNTPAEKSGLRMGDRILKVDGEDTQGQTLSEVVAKIRGEKGSKVTLTLQREKETFDVTLTRDTIPIETVHGEIAAENAAIGKIEITSFGEETAGELKEVITALRSEGATSFVLDVRQNPGGLLDQVQIMASMFLTDGQTIVKFASNAGVISETKASETLDGGFKVTEPVVVLVDGGSASASEIFAAALQESAGIPIVGTETFGKGTVQNIKDLGDNSELKMTIMKWLTPNEEWVNDQGVMPDYEADYPAYAYLAPLPRDNALKAGQSSDAVSNLNQFLAALGYDTEGDTFNDQTAAAVTAFQKKMSLTESGEVDAETAQAIEQAVTEKIKAEDPAYLKALSLLAED
ncbi:S41 family peptidase [Enterococcus sp.]|uniref:S41 family peptidase n=1 Tax=Enterococcus sp. TaxID=35783 RepID=UPI000EEF2ACE|nr:S41 family peptidase [Enterococcus sp.]HCE12140.1 peptidase S41 [Enterococcus sp.]